MFDELPDPLIYDLAISYAEEEVGRFDFINNWNAIKEKPLWQDNLLRWLKSRGYEQDFPAVSAALDRLCASKAAWIR